ncbi:sensor domain-containing diguanylate cyclase [Butyrivibrio sp. VCB2001]|uniref:sensor domain-containing diguanylate cyclase n=1 Tax=Butyrivibrio sp. VCB2001 TaxID=1280667 RepID=UPI0003F5A36C|nr:sensor domain-containing diguanylate cyclase [Butyrivibrio sp. VCB2001]
MKKSITAGLITFIAALAITTVIAIVYITTAAGNRRERAEFIAESVADRIEAEIQRRDYITRMLEIEVSSSKEGITPEKFAITADEVFNDYMDIVDITLAPGGIVSYKYPLEGGIAEREDLFSDGVDGIYADYSKMSGLGIIMAPVTLSDGSYGIILRRPIYLGEVSEENFWGFASVKLNLSSFLSDVNIRALVDGGYEYKLLGDNPITGENRMIMEYSEKELASPVSSMINTVGGSYWTLLISPTSSWMNLYEIIGALAIAVVISVLAALAAAAYVSMKAYSKELEVLSYRDALTNINNNRSYQEHMEELSKKKLPYGLIFMDLNDFKQVNDTYGHEAGDTLLNIVAKRLQNSIREKDKAFRIGGDEFVVVIHGTHDKQFYEGVIERMRHNVARDVTLNNGIILKVSISAGFARCPEDGAKFEDVVKKADDAMYHNKRAFKAQRNGGSRAGDAPSGR